MAYNAHLKKGVSLYKSKMEERKLRTGEGIPSRSAKKTAQLNGISLTCNQLESALHASAASSNTGSNRRKKTRASDTSSPYAPLSISIRTKTTTTNPTASTSLTHSPLPHPTSSSKHRETIIILCVSNSISGHFTASTHSSTTPTTTAQAAPSTSSQKTSTVIEGMLHCRRTITYRTLSTTSTIRG